MGCEQTWRECVELAALALLVSFLSDISFPECVVSKCPHALPHHNTDRYNSVALWLRPHPHRF